MTLLSATYYIPLAKTLGLISMTLGLISMTACVSNALYFVDSGGPAWGERNLCAAWGERNLCAGLNFP